MLVHAGSHSATERTNVSAVFSTDSGRTWGNEAMVWESPLGGTPHLQHFNRCTGVPGGTVTFNNVGLRHVGVHERR